MIISDKRIVKEMFYGRIIIDPYNPDNLNSSSYDLTLGEWYYRERRLERDVYNIFSEEQTKQVWGEPQWAMKAKEINRLINGDMENINLDDRVIMIAPGETILAHTEEFVGGCIDITTMMKARSSYGRVFIEVTKCSGWGDVGYINRWTMEITNNSRYYHIPLVCHRRICQLVFFRTYNVKKQYGDGDKYQHNRDIQDIKDSWTPEQMLPKLWRDREIS